MQFGGYKLTYFQIIDSSYIIPESNQMTYWFIRKKIDKYPSFRINTASNN